MAQNPTGFNHKEFVRAATSKQWRAKDPWQKKWAPKPRNAGYNLEADQIRSEAWRYTGPFTRTRTGMEKVMEKDITKVPAGQGIESARARPFVLESSTPSAGLRSSPRI
ncbi:hypothetical protein DV736_g1740, partial [Chaetothyriales sp. CBS 134916]